MSKVEVTSPAETWPDDLMGRKAHANFLTAYIEERVKAAQASLTIALDADWGAGKTFFISHWARDLEATRRGVMVFDAWKNDTASDPVLGFMAELQHGMQLLRKKVPTGSKLADSIRQTLSSAVKSARKAVLPAASAMAAGMLKKATGIVASEVAEAYQEGDSTMGDLDVESLQDFGTEQLNKSLDVFFKKTLEDHRARGKATETFRIALQRLVAQLGEAQAIDGPLYIFVDELDRCRPDYAIRLLEGIKHLFAVPGVVFVVSTNLEQLGNSVQAIYGAAFDGTAYLKRFFDLEAELPPPDNWSFARMLVKSPAGNFKRNIDYGLGNSADDHDENVAKAFQLIAQGLALPLRTQQRVYVMAAAAAAGIPQRASVAVLWLFFLAALKHTNPVIFKDVSARRLEIHAFEPTISKMGAMRTMRIESPRGFGRNQTVVEVPLSSVLRTYYNWTIQSQGSLVTTINQTRDLTYPESLASLHVQDSYTTPSGERKLQLAQYTDLISSAGFLRG
jgi:hypothetical protein